MADEITYSGLSGHFTTSYRLLAQNMVDALYERINNVLPFLRRSSLVGEPTTVDKFPKPPKLSASGLTDGTDLANTAFSPDSVNLTVAEVGLMLTLTDLARGSSIEDYAFYGAEAGKAVAEKLIGDIVALAAGFATAGVDTTGVDLTEQGFRDTKTALITANVPGPYVAVLHPQQVNDLETSIGSSIDAAGTTGQSARAETNDLSMGPDNDLGVLYGVRVIASPQVVTANLGADYHGGMFAAGRTLAHVEKWAVRPEMERDASLRASEIVVTSAYAVGEIDDASGRGIITDA